MNEIGSTTMSVEEKMEVDARSIYVGNVSVIHSTVNIYIKNYMMYTLMEYFLIK